MTDWYNTNKDENADVPPPLPFKSRRSSIVCRNGCVSTSQPLASSIGLQILLKGGNAADAAVATAAALAVLEPCSTGLGGDMFALHYDSASRSVSSVNGSGRCPKALTLDVLRKAFPLEGVQGVDIDADKFRKSAFSVTVPGAARGWEDYYRKYASQKFTFAELLEPAAQMADDGFPVAPITAKYWSDGLETDIKRWVGDKNDAPFTIDGTNGPKAGDLFRNPDMARVLRSLGEHGATHGFYQSFPGQAIVDAVKTHGGVMTMEDMQEDATQSTFPSPISVTYEDKVRLWQIPPNGQGIAGLIALSGFDSLRSSGIIEQKVEVADDGSGWKSSQTWHAMIEAMRLGFADAKAYVCDIEADDVKSSENDRTKSNPEYLLDQKRIADRIKQKFDPCKAAIQGIPDPTSCTVSFQVVDKDGNAVSFVNSNYMGFGTGIVPEGCGFTLQNRGFGFSLDENHPNALKPSKRPYHTIIPGMLTHVDTNELYATISNMGGYMQPQGHMQLTIGLVSTGLDPQTIIDMPRFCIADGTHNGSVCIEEGVDDTIINELEAMGHRGVQHNAVIKGYGRSLFGKAQIIKRDRETGVLWAGSDGRSDGCAMGY